MCTLLVDTGADVSILKSNVISESELVNINETCSITGITEQKLETIGTISTDIICPDNVLIKQKFQLIADEFPLPTDGILGRDFLTKFRCNINYDSWILTAFHENKEIEFTIQDNLSGHFVIPPRCEVLRIIDSGLLQGNYFMDSAEILPGVFCAKSIINTRNHLIKIINTTPEMIKISKTFDRTYEPLENFDVFTFNKIDSQNRQERLRAELKLDGVPNEAKPSLTSLCSKFSDIFALQDDNLTCNNFYKQEILLNDQTPVYTKNYRIPEVHRKEINENVEKLLNDNIIRPSVSPYNSPILLVPKKSNDGTKKNWRLVVDFRRLNKNIIADKFPLPRIDDILDQLGRAKYFTTLDLMSGFHQIELNDSSKKYTAFSTSNGHYEFNRLPFGLNISPNSFQRMMTIALSGLPPECAFLYIDDIIIVGCSIKHHLVNLEKVFLKLREYNLKLNPSKCMFFRSDVTYLGHHISSEGIQPDKSKFSAILNYPEPQNADDVRRFTAFCNYYRRFIPYFSEITAPLNKLLRKGVKFEWNDTCKKAFDKLKQKLLSPTILKFPNYDKQFILSTDASKIACGAVLAQPYGDIELPISYASKTFTKGESNKSTIEQELTAIHWAINHFRPYLYGRRFTVKTDHRPLVYLFSMKDPNSKLTRMRVDLEEFTFDVEHISGKQNILAETERSISRYDRL